MLYAYPVIFSEDQNGTIIARVPDVPGTMTVGGNRAEALERVRGAIIVMLAARMQDHQPIPRPSKAARAQRVTLLSPLVAAKLSLYEAMRARRVAQSDLAQKLGWDAARVRRVLDLRRRSKLEDIEAALGALGKRLVIDVADAA
jgi:antitoxin HicB